MAKGEPYVFPRPLPCAPTPGFARLFLQAAEVAKPPLGGETRFVCAETVGSEVRGPLFQMKAHFLRHFGFSPTPAEQTTQTMDQTVKDEHGDVTPRRRAQADCMTCAMIAVMRSHAACSVSSCFRPVRVSV